MNTQSYLDRIGYDGPASPTLETLSALHRAHLLAVPFENLYIHSGRPIVLDEAWLFDKIVTQRRGGFCYELNGAFAMLLRAVGFKVDLLAARVAAEGVFGIEFDHMALLVTLEDRWLADVGFGESFRHPLHIGPELQTQNGQAYRLTPGDPEWTYLQEENGVWKAQYAFKLQPYGLADFSGGCHYHQTSPDSHFTRQRICSRATPTGRVTLSGLRLIVTENGTRQERLLANEDECRQALLEHFGLE